MTQTQLSWGDAN